MKIRTVHVTVPAPRDAVFSFLAEIGNLPEWATEFCRRVERRGSRWVAQTSQGEMHLAIESDPVTGVIDLHIGPEPSAMELFPMRVLSLPSGDTLVLLTFAQSPGLPDELYERQYQSLGIEMAGFAARFGGAVHACELGVAV
jgi:hypothetical protein